MCLDDPAISIDGSVPKLVHGVPNEMIIRNRVLETSVPTFIVCEGVTYDVATECSVRKIRPTNEHLVRNIAGSYGKTRARKGWQWRNNMNDAFLFPGGVVNRYASLYRCAETVIDRRTFGWHA